MLVLAVMYRVVPASPHATLLTTSGIFTVPRCLPSGEMIHTPPGPEPYRLPFLSTRIPSGPPGDLSADGSQNNVPSPTDPSFFTGYRIHTFLPESAMYRN